MLENTFKGSAITKTGGNNNLAQLNDPKIDKAMDEAELLRAASATRPGPSIDKMIIAEAPAVPYVWDNTNLIRSKNVNGVGNAYMNSWDLAFTSIK